MSTNKVEILITDNLDIWTGTIKKRGSQGADIEVKFHPNTWMVSNIKLLQ